MRTDLFDFELPAACIALRPASPRDSARMLVVQPDGVLRDRGVSDLPLWLEPGDQLVVNDTRVISAQLTGRRIGRPTEPKIEATLMRTRSAATKLLDHVDGWQKVYADDIATIHVRKPDAGHTIEPAVNPKAK